MRRIRHMVAGEQVTIHAPDFDEDLDEFRAFMAQGDQFLSVDTESSGLDLFSPNHFLRLVQIGNSTDAWVLRVDKFAQECIWALTQPRNWVAHNVPFDALTLDRHLGIKLEMFAPRVHDTKIGAHLLDPRGQEEGGIGLGLKNLSVVHVDPEAADTQNALTKVFNYHKWTKRTGFARIAIDHTAFTLYAGLDVIYDHRLFHKIRPAIAQYGELYKLEHKLQYLLMLMQRKGMLLDIPYIERLIIDLHNEFVTYCDVAAEHGVESVYSPTEVAQALVAMGEDLTERTEGGNLKVDRAVLEPLADINRNFKRLNVREPNPLAEAVIRAKRASKWSEAYAEGFMKWRDADNRLHPVINSLQARTARMSVSNPPLQQLPSGDWRIRRAFIADPGHVMIACDYKAVEMRVLAALSNDWTMRDAIARGLDLHSFTAERVFGEGFTDKERKIAKNIGFGKVYGGGAVGVARLTGADEASVRTAMQAYDATFPGIKRYSQKLIKDAKQGLLEVVTPLGRRLPLDEDRLYAATNYIVQSTARDFLAQAIIRLFEAGLGDYLLLPVHDELLGQAPIAEADDVIAEIGKVMATTFRGVEIASDAHVIGHSWGDSYGAPQFMSMELLERLERKPRPGQWTQAALLF